MSQTHGQRTKDPVASQKSVNNSSGQKKKRRNKNKKKTSMVISAAVEQNQVVQKNDTSRVQNLQESSDKNPETINTLTETKNNQNEVKTENIILSKKIIKAYSSSQSFSEEDSIFKSHNQDMTSREKNDASSVKLQTAAKPEAKVTTGLQIPGRTAINVSNPEAQANGKEKKLSKKPNKEASSVKLELNTPNDSETDKVKNANSSSVFPAEISQDISTKGKHTTEKSRAQIMAEREAKRMAKQAMKTSKQYAVSTELEGKIENTKVLDTIPLKVEQEKNTTAKENTSSIKIVEKSREQIMAEREAKKMSKQALKTSKQNTKLNEVGRRIENLKISDTISATNIPSVEIGEEKKKPTLNKAERRALQEAQRAAKTQAQQKKAPLTLSTISAATKQTHPTPKIIEKSSTPSTKQCIKSPTKFNACKVKLFNHIESAKKDVNLFVNNSQIHPIIARLGEQYTKRTVVGSNARCIAFLNALKIVIQDFETPPKKEFTRSLESFIKNCVDYLHQCRPLAVSVRNAYKHIKQIITQLSTEQAESDLKENLCHFIDTYLENQIGKAAQAISCSMQEKISNGDVILTFGCSSLINYIFEEAHRRNVDFRVIVVDSRPYCEGQELLRRLCAKEIPCTYVLINAVSFVMPEVTKILLGAHALLSNGYVMARTGSAQVALVARSFNVPVLVCCETHKFSERFQTDAIVYNELGNPDDLILSEKCCLTNWHTKDKMSPLNLNYDVTPPELVTAVVTEVSILPCTSVPVILRIKPTEIGYYN